jgi:oligopeptide/dipeptide ABC transporter ATP-binding protein
MHPYTKLLFSAVPDISRPFLSEDAVIRGEIPNPTNLPTGCYFAPRCPAKTADCCAAHPALAEKDQRHFVRCFNVGG